MNERVYSREEERKTHLRIMLVVVLLRADPTCDELIEDSMRESEVIVAFSGDIAVLDEREVEMPIERLLDIRH